MNRQLWPEVNTCGGVVQKQEQRKVAQKYRGISQACIDGVKSAKVQLEINPDRDFMDMK